MYNHYSPAVFIFSPLTMYVRRCVCVCVLVYAILDFGLTYPLLTTSAISFWSVPAIVLRRLPLDRRGRDRRRIVSPSLPSGWPAAPAAPDSAACSAADTKCSKDFLVVHMRSNRRPEVSTLMVSAGNLQARQKNVDIIDGFTIYTDFGGSYLSAIIWHCSSGDGNLWSSGMSGSRPDPRVLRSTTMMSSVSSNEALVPAWYEGDPFCVVLLPARLAELLLPATRAVQSGGTVISPIASIDVHFLKSSIAEGCKETHRRESDV